MIPVSQIKTHIGIPAADNRRDDVIRQIIDGVSGYIESATNRTLRFASHTEVIDGTNEDEIFLSHYPIVQVVSLTINGQAINLTQETTDRTIIVNNETGSIYRKDRFGSGRKAVQIVYGAGYSTVYGNGVGAKELPPEIVLAVVRLTARIYERRTAEGIASVSPVGISVSYKDVIDADIKQIIESNKKRRL